MAKSKWIEAELNETVFEYSEEPEKLRSFIKKNDLKIYYKIIDGVKRKDSKYWNLLAKIKMSTKTNVIYFDFYFSHNDYEKWVSENVNPENIYYSVLCSCGTDWTTAETFEEFCLNMGYNSDSISDLKIFKSCQKQTLKLKKIFTDKDIRFLPS